MTPREQVERVLRGGKAEYVPFTAYENKTTPCDAERWLRNNGMCVVYRVDSLKTASPNVKVRISEFEEYGTRKMLVEYETPAGKLTKKSQYQVLDTATGALWHEDEKLWKSKEDYKSIAALIRDREYAPAYDAVIKKQKFLGDGFIVRDGCSCDPIHELMITYMGIENFIMEWNDNRDEVLKLYGLLVEDGRKRYKLAAGSPTVMTNVGGNIVFDLLGPEIVEKYMLPNFLEAKEEFKKTGKLMGAHMDANNKLLIDFISRSGLDVVEAFTPSPGTDMTLREGFDAWPDKIIWANFPSAVHLRPDNEVESTAERLLAEAGADKGRLIMGITEDVPNGRWPATFRVILEACRKYGKIV